MEKVTKDPKRMKAARKGREKYMNKLEEIILNDAKKGSRDTTNASNETTNASNETASATNTATTPATSTRSYVYSLSTFAVLAIGVCICFAYPKTKKQANEKKRD